MLYFLIGLLAAVTGASVEQPPPLCAPHSNATEVQTAGDCMQQVVVSERQAAELFFTNRDKYCGQLSEDERKFAEITEISGKSTLINFCNAPSPSFSLHAGTYYIRVSRNHVPLQLSLTYHVTNLGCDDVVPPWLVGIPLTFEPTRHKCSLVLPGRTILEIKGIHRSASANKVRGPQCAKTRHCLRVRMGKHMYGLHYRWKAVCEIPAGDVYEYELGCGAVVMDASSVAIEMVEFVLLPMDDLKAAIAPLMCSDDHHHVMSPNALHSIRPNSAY